MNKSADTIVVLGASDNPERYSNKAVGMLLEHGFKVIPVNPAGKRVHGLVSVKELSEVEDQVHTLTVYVNPQISWKLRDEIINLKPGRIIFNPGTENSELEALCAENGIRVVRACTLVLLRTGQFQEA